MASRKGGAQPTRQVSGESRCTEEWRFAVELNVQMLLIGGPDVPGKCGLQYVCMKNVLPLQKVEELGHLPQHLHPSLIGAFLGHSAAAACRPTHSCST